LNFLLQKIEKETN